MNLISSHAQGCLAGLFIGDALGAQFEFTHPQLIQRLDNIEIAMMVGGGPFFTKSGQITDDGEMALCLIHSILEDKEYITPHTKNKYTKWARSNPVDMGITIRNALLNNKKDPKSESNGALMRVAPLGIYGYNHWDRLPTLALEDASITHCNRRVYECNYMFTCAIALMMDCTRDNIDIISQTRHWARIYHLDNDLLNDIKTKPEDYYSCMGHVDIAFRNAFYHLNRGSSFEHSIVDTIRQGGDTDTNAAIVGALMGAYHGIENIPLCWLNTVLSCHTDRPLEYQPKNILVLADKLLTLE